MIFEINPFTNSFNTPELMHALYRLEDILRLLKKEKKQGYSKINFLIDFYEESKQEKFRKLMGCIATLRFLGLYEQDFSNPDKVMSDSYEEPKEIQSLHMQAIPAPYIFLDADIMGGSTMIIDVILN